MKTFLIDLDGTIINSALGVTKSIQYGLSTVNVNIEDLDSLKRHIGPPISEGFKSLYNLTQEEADSFVIEYRKHYEDQGVHMNELYEGIDTVISEIREKGHTVIVATSKPEVFAKQILESFEISHLFNDICGASLDKSRNDKAGVIKYALEKNKIHDLNCVYMIGDTKYDIEGAKISNLKSIGVLYGFGTREQLEKEGADEIVASVEDLRKLLHKYI